MLDYKILKVLNVLNNHNNNNNNVYKTLPIRPLVIFMMNILTISSSFNIYKLHVL